MDLQKSNILMIGPGARGLRSIIEETMLDVMFEVPSQENVKLVRITKETVDGTDKPILETA
ncbi:ATP-dependent protease ATP-binding subunit [Streptococcus pneumoniae]|nr:ATP-dependent protease ATP-binding subunit [Streptococcus pneumoniae]